MGAHDPAGAHRETHAQAAGHALTVEIRPVAAAELEPVLELIAAYQRFYGAVPDQERNRRFFVRFLAPSEDGLLLGAWEGEHAVGHACLYWTFSSTRAEEEVLLNDLYVREERRGRGVGRRLIEAAAAVARGRGVTTLAWMTAPDNVTAQRLYDATGARRTPWLEYELRVSD